MQDANVPKAADSNHSLTVAAVRTSSQAGNGIAILVNVFYTMYVRTRTRSNTIRHAVVAYCLRTSAKSNIGFQLSSLLLAYPCL